MPGTRAPLQLKLSHHIDLIDLYGAPRRAEFSTHALPGASLGAFLHFSLFSFNF